MIPVIKHGTLSKPERPVIFTKADSALLFVVILDFPFFLLSLFSRASSPLAVRDLMIPAANAITAAVAKAMTR